MKIAPHTEKWNEGEQDWSYVKDPCHDVELWEKENRIKLPPDYRNFILRFNGGCVYPRQFRTPLAIGPVGPYFCESDVTYIDLILDWKSVEMHWKGETYGEGVPPMHLVIAETPGSIQLLMALTDDNYGKIYSWCHSTNTWGTDSNDVTHFQSNDFQSFLKSLIDQDGSDFENWQRPIYNKLARNFESP
jgi:hypothetical protein